MVPTQSRASPHYPIAPAVSPTYTRTSRAEPFRGASMRNIRRGLTLTLAAAFAWLAATSLAAAQKASLDDLIAAVVRVKTVIHPEGRTMQSDARERDGSGIVIDSSGLVLTIGYLMVEAYAAEIIANDGRRVPANIVG